MLCSRRGRTPFSGETADRVRTRASGAITDRRPLDTALGQSAARSLWRRRHSLRYFGDRMRCSILRRPILTALLALALLGGQSSRATAADAGSRDVQVNLDVLDSLGPAPGASAAATGEIHLHAPRPKIKATPATATRTPTRAPASTVATAAPQHEAAAKPVAETAAAAAPGSAASDAPPSTTPSPSPPSAAPPSAATATASPSPAAVALAPAAVPRAAAAPPLASTNTSPPPAAQPSPAPALRPAASHAPPPTRLLFAAGAADLPDSAKPKLDTLADWLDANLQARIEVVAYAAGSGEHANDARRMSLSRALAVRSYLAQHGIATARMEVRALGNHSAEGEPLDRVDILPMDH
jgi:outer membrane protein OmpA-like peptidoglycan-associated protein